MMRDRDAMVDMERPSLGDAEEEDTVATMSQHDRMEAAIAASDLRQWFKSSGIKIPRRDIVRE